MKWPVENSEFRDLVECSAMLGRNPLMVQGGTGNTSIKFGATLWIKASGRWLANARDEHIFVPVDISAARYSIGHNTDPSLTSPGPLRSSVETAMHCVLPHRVVIHVHSVSSIVWAVRRDAQTQLAARLDGLPWTWIPYVASGLPLARAIENAVFANPHAQAFILGNHGIVTAGPDCATALGLLSAVDQRLHVEQRCAPPDASSAPAEFFDWLAGDPVARRILSGGYLYPCHVLYLEGFGGLGGIPGRHITAGRERETLAALNGLAQVVSRIPASCSIRYLTAEEVADVRGANVYQMARRISPPTTRLA